MDLEKKVIIKNNNCEFQGMALYIKIKATAPALMSFTKKLNASFH